MAHPSYTGCGLTAVYAIRPRYKTFALKVLQVSSADCHSNVILSLYLCFHWIAVNDKMPICPVPQAVIGVRLINFNFSSCSCKTAAQNVVFRNGSSDVCSITV